MTDNQLVDGGHHQAGAEAEGETLYNQQTSYWSDSKTIQILYYKNTRQIILLRTFVHLPRAAGKLKNSTGKKKTRRTFIKLQVVTQTT